MPLAMVQAQINSGELVALTRESRNAACRRSPCMPCTGTTVRPGRRGAGSLDQLKDGSRNCPTTLAEFQGAGAGGR